MLRRLYSGGRGFSKENIGLVWFAPMREGVTSVEDYSQGFEGFEDFILH